MNGSNSNTSGANVGNVGFWPKNILPKLVKEIGGLWNSLKSVVSGDATLAAVDFAPLGGTDQVADNVMDEIARRLVVTVEKQSTGNLVAQPLPPDDHTKLWLPTDAITAFPRDVVQQWSEQQGKWVPADLSSGQYVPPKQRRGLLTSPAGNSTQNLPFEDIETEDYSVNITPTTRDVTNNAWLPPPTSFPAAFGFVIVNKTNTLLSVAFYGVPTGGITWEIDLEERLVAADITTS